MSHTPCLTEGSLSKTGDFGTECRSLILLGLSFHEAIVYHDFSINPHPPPDCQARLSGAIDKERRALISFTAIFGSKRVVGWVTETSMRLRTRIYYRISGQIYITGAMRQYPVWCKREH